MEFLSYHQLMCLQQVLRLLHVARKTDGSKLYSPSDRLVQFVLP